MGPATHAAPFCAVLKPVEPFGEVHDKRGFVAIVTAENGRGFVRALNAAGYGDAR